jgi:ABC-2 type transport system permease protein
MNAEMIGALLRKDLVLFFSNRFFALVTILALVAYAAIYFLMPDQVDETLEMAIYTTESTVPLGPELAESGVVLHEMSSPEALREAVAAGEQQVGAVLPAGFARNVALGQPQTVQLYFSAAFPEEFKELYIIFFRELGFILSGQPLNIEVEEEVLGVDRAGEQIAYRDRMLPLFAIFVLMVEMLGLASLIAGEITEGTISALLVTPLRVEGLFTAKAIFGVGLAFIQAVLLLAVTGGLNQQPLLVLVLLLLGAFLVTGLGFLIASVAHDLMSVMGWGVVAIVAMSLPAFSVLLPGLTTGWVRAIPSYYLVDGMNQVLNYGAGWEEVGGNLLALALLSALFLALGIVVLRRRFR